MNLTILTGNLGRDPEIRYTKDGSAVANINLATTERVKGEDRTEWHRLVAFGKTAELMGQYLFKGSKIGVQGKLQTRKWQDKDGNNRYTTEVVVDRMEFLDSKGNKGQGQSQGQPQGQQGYPGPNDHVPGQESNIDDGSIPF